MESSVKSHISNKTYSSNLEKLEEQDKDETSELYRIPISGHNIMIAPGKTIMENGIAYCYAYVIKDEKVVCKLGVYEKKTDTIPLFFDISTFPEGSFCLFEEFEKNPSKLMDLKMVESTGRNLFDFLMDEFSKIKEKKDRLKGAYRSLYERYKELIKIDKEKKNKKMEAILRIISEAAKESDPSDEFLKTMKKNAEDKPVFVMTLIALEPIFMIQFNMVTDNDEYHKMKKDWPISNATKEIDVDVNTYTISEPSIKPVETEPVETEQVETEPVETEVDLNAEDTVPEPVEETEPEPEAESEAEAEPEPEPEPDSEPEAEPEPDPERGISLNSILEPTEKKVPRGTSLNSVIETKPKTKSKSKIKGTSLNTEKEKKGVPKTIPEEKTMSMPETAKKSKKSATIIDDDSDTEPVTKPEPVTRPEPVKRSRKTTPKSEAAEEPTRPEPVKRSRKTTPKSEGESSKIKTTRGIPKIKSKQENSKKENS